MISPRQVGGPQTGDWKQNLSGALDLILGRDRGLSKIDVSADGFWRSFVGLILAGAVDAGALIFSHPMRIQLEDPPSQGPVGFAFLSLSIALVAYVASMVALYLLCQTPDSRARFPMAVIVNNWAAPIVSLAFAPILFIMLSMRLSSMPEPPGAVAMLLLMASVVVLIMIGIRLIRISLNLTQGQAGLLFGVTALVSWTVERWLSGLAGL